MSTLRSQKQNNVDLDQYAAAFDGSYYMRRYPDCSTENRGALAHFLTVGIYEGRAPTPAYEGSAQASAKSISSLRKSILSQFIDRDFYWMEYPDVRIAGIDPVEHFLGTGMFERRLPNPLAKRFSADADAPAGDKDEPHDWGREATPASPVNTDAFDPAYYLANNADAGRSEADALRHFLTSGIFEGRSPNEPYAEADAAEKQAIIASFVDAQFYLSEYHDVSNAGLDPREHFASSGVREGRFPSALAKDFSIARSKPEEASGRPSEQPSPSARGKAVLKQLFDEKFYLREHEDVRQAGAEPFAHFLANGMKEGRSPNPWFDGAWYAQSNSVDPTDGDGLFAHYLTNGIKWGSFPLAELGQAGAHVGHKDFTLDDYIALNKATSTLQGDCDIRLSGIKYLCRIFDPVYYRFRIQSVDYQSIIQLIGYYLTHGIHRGDPLSRAFNHRFYLFHSDLPPQPSVAAEVWAALEDWRTAGRAAKRSTSPVFDAAEYARANKDLDPAVVDLQEHFLMHGVFEGRRVNKYPAIPAATRPGKDKGYSALNLYVEPARSALQSQPSFARKISLLAFSRQVNGLIEAAQKIEPAIQGLHETDAFLAPPWHASHFQALRNVIGRLSAQSYDYVVCVPWMQMGGADLIASHLAKSLGRGPGKPSVLVIQTDSPKADRSDWFNGLDQLDFTDVFAPGIDRAGTEYILFSVLRYLAPKAVFNVNSRLAFDVFVRFGRRMRDFCDIYSYYFCWDQTPQGRRVGYPSEYFPQISGFSTGSITDSEFLRNELIDSYSLPPQHQAKLHVLRTPQHEGVPGKMAKPRESSTFGGRDRPLILWAGRFDRQKRYDLVCEIAKAMPDVDFGVWGAQVLDAGTELPRAPANMMVRKPYKSIDEIPLDVATGWLYTSGWDGIPTILIELGARKIPVVASQVGGVGELIDATTGWPVPPNAQINDYIDALLEMINNPALATRKAAALHERVNNMHSIEQYSQNVQEILNRGQS